MNMRKMGAEDEWAANNSGYSRWGAGLTGELPRITLGSEAESVTKARNLAGMVTSVFYRSE